MHPSKTAATTLPGGMASQGPGPVLPDLPLFKEFPEIWMLALSLKWC